MSGPIEAPADTVGRETKRAKILFVCTLARPAIVALTSLNRFMKKQITGLVTGIAALQG
jgi:hypothetical protein